MNIIAHCGANWALGKDNRLLFSLPGDMAFFRRMTTGNTVVMGDMTVLSLPGGKPLKNRRTLVMTIDPEFTVEGAEICHSVKELFARISELEIPSGEVYVCGGAAIYSLLLPYCDTAYITMVEASPEADRFLPDMDMLESWSLAECSEPERDGDYTVAYRTYRNRSPKTLPPEPKD